MHARVDPNNIMNQAITIMDTGAIWYNRSLLGEAFEVDGRKLVGRRRCPEIMQINRVATHLIIRQRETDYIMSTFAKMTVSQTILPLYLVKSIQFNLCSNHEQCHLNTFIVVNIAKILFHIFHSLININ